MTTARSATATLVAIAADDDGARVDVALARALTIQRAAARRLCDEGRVRRGAARLAAGDRVAAGDAITIEAASWWGTAPLAPLAVLRETDDLVIVDKPAGLACHPLVPGEVDSVAHRLVAMNPAFTAAAPEEREAGLVHRLDTGTSGCLAAAKNRAAHEGLRAAVARADKRYVAIVAGSAAAIAGLDGATIDVPLGHDPRDRRRMRVGDQPCRTTVALRGVSDLGGGARVALVALTLVGGRRHQLRAHLAHVGAPLVGDALYGGTPDPHDDGLWLHAASLTIDGVTAHAPLPARWSRWATLDVSPTP